MTYSRVIPGFAVKLESEKPFEKYSQEELAQLTFNKAIEGVAVMVIEEFNVTEGTVCEWLRGVSDIVKERSIKKED